ncbi:CG43922 [Drosophila busckii]|uniref:CG43922 n=1 Tax=Drosophila busckii TaxID=30019 RepID=A0A0M5J3G3_DROBS|nr:uncharacterized protein LOC108608367 [Drosophila busckii]ALC38381.1 CG43922 [Drosophila busckii]
MLYNPIEIVCVYMVQPIIDYLAYLLNEVHYGAYLVAVALIGVALGLIFSLISLAWYKWNGGEQAEIKAENLTEKQKCN